MLADKAGVGLSTLANLESGFVKRARPETIRALSSVLGVKPQSLVLRITKSERRWRMTLIVIDGAEVVARREERGLTRRELAEQAGLAYSTVAAMERGERKFRVSSAVRILEPLGVERGVIGRAVSR
jgi:transcriptional regulator with XRE-family HTH domain